MMRISIISKIISALGIIFLMQSCIEQEDDQGKAPVVKVGNKILTQGMLQHAIPSGIVGDDSVTFAQGYINRWVNSELILRKAELNLSKDEKNIEGLLNDYRRSLLTHQYQQKLLKQKYSPLVKDKEIESYYKDMIDNFQLSEPIIKGIFIIVPKTAPNINSLQDLYQSSNSEDLIKLETYCFQNAKKYEVFLDEWKAFSQVNSKLPTPLVNQEQFIKYNNHYHTSDSLYHYYVSIRERLLPKDKAPLEYVHGKIKAILLNKKRLEFLKKLEEDLYKEGLEQEIIKFY